MLIGTQLLLDHDLSEVGGRTGAFLFGGGIVAFVLAFLAETYKGNESEEFPISYAVQITNDYNKELLN